MIHKHMLFRISMNGRPEKIYEKLKKKHEDIVTILEIDRLIYIKKLLVLYAKYSFVLNKKP